MRKINQTSYSVMTIEEINAIAEQSPQNLVDMSENYYNSQLDSAIQTIKDSQGSYRIILLAGPSGSGKTTTAHKLKDRFRAKGIGAKVLTMDNFYRGIANYSLMDNGKPDMESVETIDLPLLNKCLREIVATGYSQFPVFDFANQVRLDEKEEVSLAENDILIMEGIHALNPMIIENIPKDKLFRMYVSVRTKYTLKDEDVLRPSDIRLIRRMIRDTLFRGYSPQKTLEYWEHVIKSEKIILDPYRDDVEFKMDTTLDYEGCVWHELLNDTLDKVDINLINQYSAMQRIIKGLKAFNALNPDKIPENSLLREFIG